MPTWLRARDVGIETLWAGGPARVSLEPGRAEVLGAGLRWSRFAWQAGDGDRVPMRLDARAELDPRASHRCCAACSPTSAGAAT